MSSTAKVSNGKAALNKFYRGVLVPQLTERMNQIGYKIYDQELTTDDVHGILKTKFNPEKVTINGKTVITFPGSTASMDYEQFKKYVENIRNWAKERFALNISQAYGGYEIN